MQLRKHKVEHGHINKGHGQYDGQGVYYGLSPASEMFFILLLNYIDIYAIMILI